jgi:hypothetical protein
VKGDHSSCNKEVTFKFKTYSSALDKWDTVEYLSYSLPADGTNEVIKTVPFTPDIERIKLFSVQNQETVSGYTVQVNVAIFTKE